MGLRGNTKPDNVSRKLSDSAENPTFALRCAADTHRKSNTTQIFVLSIFNIMTTYEAGVREPISIKQDSDDRTYSEKYTTKCEKTAESEECPPRNKRKHEEEESDHQPFVLSKKIFKTENEDLVKDSDQDKEREGSHARKRQMKQMDQSLVDSCKKFKTKHQELAEGNNQNEESKWSPLRKKRKQEAKNSDQSFIVLNESIKIKHEMTVETCERNEESEGSPPRKRRKVEKESDQQQEVSNFAQTNKFSIFNLLNTTYPKPQRDCARLGGGWSLGLSPSVASTAQVTSAGHRKRSRSPEPEHSDHAKGKKKRHNGGGRRTVSQKTFRSSCSSHGRSKKKSHLSF